MTMIIVLGLTILLACLIVTWYFNIIEKENTKRFNKILDTYLAELQMGVKESSVAHLIPEEERQKIIDSLK